jgi:hypothetical protein
MANNAFKVKKGLIVNGSGSTILDIQGSQGQLFSVTDQLSGSLFSVNDISGIPVFEAFSDDTIKIGTFNNEAIIVEGSQTTIQDLTATGSFSGSFTGGGTDGQVQYNNNGSLDGASGLFYDDVNDRVGIGTTSPGEKFHVNGRVRIDNSTTGATVGDILQGARVDFVFTNTSNTDNALGEPDEWLEIVVDNGQGPDLYVMPLYKIS